MYIHDYSYDKECNICQVYSTCIHYWYTSLRTTLSEYCVWTVKLPKHLTFVRPVDKKLF